MRSEIFKNLLELDACKAAPTDAITLSELNPVELNPVELESLLEFLYGRDLSEEKLEKHVYSLCLVYSLSLAADKYKIPYLQKFYEGYMLRSLDCCKALDVLEIVDGCSFETLKENTLNFIVKNMEDIMFSTGYEAFALKNPQLCM